MNKTYKGNAKGSILFHNASRSSTKRTGALADAARVGTRAFLSEAGLARKK
ncbi:hypothetical protein D3C83_206590 [compost metagenome]